MSELDDKLNSILGNPQMMQQIMTLAQSLNATDATSSPSQPQMPKTSAPLDAPIDSILLSKIAGIVQRGSIDKNQKLLLQALQPYLSSQKLQKLERAMRAAKMAGIASDVIGKNAQGSNQGR